MKKFSRCKFAFGTGLIFCFAFWTSLVLLVDKKSIGPLGSRVGFASLNGWFHSLTGVNMWLYNLTDILNFIPFAFAFFFAVLGLIQLIKRKGLLNVDFDVLMLGIHFFAVIFSYLLFEILVINYRPILINGVLEASYPSSTTMLALSVMIPSIFQARKRIKNKALMVISVSLISIFTVFMLVGRLISGVHWLTDIIGGALLSGGFILIYSAFYKIKLEK